MLDILHTESSDGWGGQEARTVLKAEHLGRRGHRVRIAGPSNSGIGREARRRGIPFIPISMRSVMDLNGWFRLHRLLRRERPAILHTHSSKDSWLAGLAGKRTGVLVLIRTRHVSIPVHAHRLNPVYRIPDRIIVTASAIRDHLVRQYGLEPERVVTLPTGVDLDRFGPHVSGRPFREEFGLDERTPLVGIVFTNDIVWDRLAPHIHEELRRRDPPTATGQRRSKHHQWLTEDIGHVVLAGSLKRCHCTHASRSELGHLHAKPSARVPQAERDDTLGAG